MSVSDCLKKYLIRKFDDVSLSIEGDDFIFSYTVADAVVKEEYRGKYKYFGGLQCNYGRDTKEFVELEDSMCAIAQAVLNASVVRRRDNSLVTEITRKGRFEIYRWPLSDMAYNRNDATAKLLALTRGLAVRGYVEVPNDSGGNDDYVCVDTLKKEFIWCENGTWPFSITSLESFEDDDNVTLCELHKVRR